MERAAATVQDWRIPSVLLRPAEVGRKTPTCIDDPATLTEVQQRYLDEDISLFEVRRRGLARR